MNEKQTLNLPLTDHQIRDLKAGDMVLLNGEIYTARDAANKKLTDLIIKNEKLPIDIDNIVVYYAGPCPAKPNRVIGSIGPTTSVRMDSYSPLLIENNLKIMIGKGERSKEVIDAIKKYNGIYFSAIGGAGAILSNCIISSQVVAFEELGTEAIRKLVVKDFPLIVTIDSFGNNLYEIGRKNFAINC